MISKEDASKRRFEMKELEPEPESPFLNEAAYDLPTHMEAWDAYEAEPELQFETPFASAFTPAEQETSGLAAEEGIEGEIEPEELEAPDLEPEEETGEESIEEEEEEEEEDLQESLTPASATECMDLAEWANVMCYDEIITPGEARKINPRLKYEDFPKSSVRLVSGDYLLSKDILYGLLLMKPASGSPNYEFMLKSRVYYPRGSRRDQLAGTKAYPVVVIVHGSHSPFIYPPWAEVANHLGYEYLQRHLARHGIVSISIDINAVTILGNFSIRTAAQFILANLRLLKQLNTPGGHPKEHRFEKRLDLQSIGLVGQSRGGDAVVDAVVLLRGNADFKVKAVCQIAPTDLTGTAKPDDQLRLKAADELRYLVLYGSHDGDISGMDHLELEVDPLVPLNSIGTGFRHYDRATCPRTMVFVKGITHNGFNEKWNEEPNYGDQWHCFVYWHTPKPPDLGVWQKDNCSHRPPVPFDTDIRSAEAHRRLAIDYVGGLCRLVLNRETSRLGLFNGLIVPTDNHKYNHKVSIQWNFGKVLEIENFKNLAKNALGGVAEYTSASTVSFEHGVTLSKRLVRWVFGLMSVAKRGIVPHQTMALVANTAGARYSSLIPPDKKDFTGYDLLLLRMTSEFDVTSSATIERGRFPNFKIRFYFGKKTGVWAPQRSITRTLTPSGCGSETAPSSTRSASIAPNIT